MVTLGPGFCIFVLALVCTTDARLERVSTPLFVLAAFLAIGLVSALWDAQAFGDD